MKTVEDFKQQVKKLNITEWRFRKCSLCGYLVGYIFKENEVYFDPGCYCSSQGYEYRTWEEVAHLYNRQPQVIEAWKRFWGFKEEEVLNA